MTRFWLPLTVVAALAAGIVAGPNAWGKLALLAGQPALAAHLIEDEAARGVALYKAGDHKAADAAFEKVGRVATYDRAISLAATGQYELSVAYFDAVLFANPHDDDARRNREIVAKLVDPVVGSGLGAHGGVPAKVMGVATGDPNDPVVKGTLTDQRHVYKPLNARGIAASEGWLTGLVDAPGEYLKKRLAAEYDRRKELGQITPEASSW
ncbi:hypothetical protein HDIA_1032 [Hartmannibacter diazotrophicus]|uniref:Ca-activated chloride channel family protein n=1 Tax=Hartmannibacter diazotrophicus TaxID=1482074 RepID=A0A2C9D2W9_9HYPH|nr:hypothetical protein [Hartmannibacter diazotrophicus]SON54573.1 hypothetical protein HDIA_1032 [Hartmannibacter diazotrophicus]